MRLRRPCEHGFYDKHVTLFDPEVGPISRCPGGEFLTDDTLVTLEWCIQHNRVGEGPDHCEEGWPDSPRDDWCRMVDALLIPIPDFYPDEDSDVIDYQGGEFGDDDSDALAVRDQT